MKLQDIRRYLLRFAEQCPPGKRGRPMRPENAQATEKAGGSVCEKETRAGKTVYYRTSQESSKHKEESKQEGAAKKQAREKLGLKLRGRISKEKVEEFRKALAEIRAGLGKAGKQEEKTEPKEEKGQAKIGAEKYKEEKQPIQQEEKEINAENYPLEPTQEQLESINHISNDGEWEKAYQEIKYKNLEKIALAQLKSKNKLNTIGGVINVEKEKKLLENPETVLALKKIADSNDSRGQVSFRAKKLLEKLPNRNTPKE